MCTEELGLLLRLTRDNVNLDEYELRGFCPGRCLRVRPPKITCMASKTPIESWNGCTKVIRSPENLYQIKKIVALALRAGIGLTIKCHTFNQKI